MSSNLLYGYILVSKVLYATQSDKICKMITFYIEFTRGDLHIW